MSQPTKLEVITQQGWRREYPLTKNIVYIGSDAGNDIVLDDRYGGGVAPLQVQLIATAADNSVYKLINVGETAIVLGDEPDNRLAPQEMLELTDGRQFKLGQFSLIFHGDSQPEAGPTQNSRSIGLELDMPHTQLAPHQSLEGTVKVSNLGRQMGARFDLTLEGMEPGCYDIAPGPLLSSGAEKEVLFRLHHLGRRPLAGKWRIVIRATCPDTYPGEQATVSQVVEVLPYHHHRLNLAPAKGFTLSAPPPAQVDAPPPRADIGQDWDVQAHQSPPVAPKTAEPKKNGANSPAPVEAAPMVLSPAAEPAPPPAAQTSPPVPDSSWAQALEQQTTSRPSLAQTQKLKVMVPAQNSAPPVTEKDKDWWGTP